MSEDLFPSGPWTGFYNYGTGRERHRMDLSLQFSNSIISGCGSDDIARFLIRGRYDSATRECFWTKTYPGSHDVFYKGFREGKGIWGTWEIGTVGSGGFHIWPQGSAAGEEEELSVSRSEPAEAVSSAEITTADQR